MEDIKNQYKKEYAVYKALIELSKDKDMDKITVFELVKTAGISRSSFYRMFDSVDNVIKMMENDILENLRDICWYYISSKLDLDDVNGIDDSIFCLLSYFYQIRDAYVSLNSVHGDEQFRYKHENTVKEFFGGRLAYNKYWNWYG